MNDNVILATFNHNSEITTKPSVQWNRGQILKIEGIYNLPNVFEVEVSNDRERGAKRYLGENYEFVIPDEYFQSGKMIYIWIMKRVEPSDITSKYLVKIPMKTRQKPLDYDYNSEQRDIVAEAVVALQDAEQEITTKMNEVINREKKVERIEESFYNLTALAETLPAGSEATVDKEKVDTDENNYMIFRFGIPQGIQGERGDKGETGNQGETGNGIQNIVLNSDYTLTINFTDGTSTTTRSIRGEKGDTFVYSDFTPEQLALLKGDKGDEGHSPVITASKSGKTTTITVDNTIIATINDGENGQDGNDGHSPVITASKTNGVTTIKVDDTTIATVNDGLNGDKGDKGDKGDTPIITASKINGVTSVSADGTVIATINDGDKGDKGNKGDKGDKGDQGIQGEKGDKGDKGDPGISPTIDSTPTQGSTNAVSSGGVYDYLDEISALDAKTINHNSMGKISAYINWSRYAIAADSYTRVAYFSCQGNTEYTINKVLSEKFRVGYTTNLPADNVNVYNIKEDLSATTMTYTTGADAVYVVIYYYDSHVDTLDENDIFNSFEITYGEELTAVDKVARVGLSENIKQALLACFQQVAWIGEHGQDYYDALESALYEESAVIGVNRGIGTSGIEIATNEKRMLSDPIPFTNTAPITVKVKLGSNSYVYNFKFTDINNKIIPTNDIRTPYNNIGYFKNADNSIAVGSWGTTVEELTFKDKFTNVATVLSTSSGGQVSNGYFRLLFGNASDDSGVLPQEPISGYVIVQGKKYTLAEVNRTVRVTRGMGTSGTEIASNEKRMLSDPISFANKVPITIQMLDSDGTYDYIIKFINTEDAVILTENICNESGTLAIFRDKNMNSPSDAWIKDSKQYTLMAGTPPAATDAHSNVVGEQFSGYLRILYCNGTDTSASLPATEIPNKFIMQGLVYTMQES